MPDLPAPSTSSIRRGGLTVHTFTAPDAFLAGSTHVLESDGGLVVIDGQFAAPYAIAFRRFVDALNKPIRRVYASHAHAGHRSGLSTAFPDAPVHAAAAGFDTIDGVDYRTDVVTAAECPARPVLTLPGHGVTVVQDLVYSGTHVYVTRDAADIAALLRVLATSGSDVFLAGHGPVADAAEVLRNADYLAFAEQRLAHDDPAAFRAALLAAYPQRRCPQLLDIFIPRLYEPSTMEVSP
jgi:hypothetical protein